MNVWVGALRDGIALRLGTVAELRALVQYKCELKAGGRAKEAQEAARSSALGDYLRALDEVRASADEPREQKQESERD